MAVQMAMSWHSGEVEMQRLLRVPDMDNPTSPGLNTRTAYNLQVAPLLAVGTLDDDKRPWSSLWGGDNQFARPLGQSIIGIKTRVDGSNDPVIEALFGDNTDGTLLREQGRGRMVGALTVNLDMRKRAKLYGRFVAGAVNIDQEENTEAKGQAEAQLVVKIEQSLGEFSKTSSFEPVIADDFGFRCRQLSKIHQL